MPDPNTDPNGDPKPDKDSWIRGLGLFGVITAELLGASVVGVGSGYLLWKKAGMPWWVLLVCSVAGLSVAFYRLYLISRKDF
jgi:F0F1-type ATP synthase assembly protein I